MRIDSLTSLRFFAALAVFLHHMEFFNQSASPEIVSAFQWLWEGFFGVQFFYILSGFVIAYSFEQRRSRGPYPFSDFLFFRAARLFPIHWLTMLVAAGLYGSFVAVDWENLLRLGSQITLTQAWFASSTSFYFGYNGVAWSISVEMFFYAAFCVLCFLPTRTLVIVGGALLSIVLVNVVTADMSQSMTNWLLYINPFFRLIDFLTGILLYRWFVAKPLKLGSAQASALEIASIAVAGLFVWASMTYQVPMQWRWDVYYILPMAAVVFVFAHQQGALSRMLSNRFLVLLGEASFALYMVHQLLISYSLRFFNPAEILDLTTASQIAVLILAAGIALSIVTHLCFEMPVNNALRRWWLGRKNRPAPA